MTIVEMVDVNGGFTIITDKIKTTKKLKLIWIIFNASLFFSAVLDNLATSIVMASLLNKMMKNKKDVWMFGGLVVLAANAGGAWSPIGDVTTIMLICFKSYVSEKIILNIFLPSLVCAIVPLIYLSFKVKGDIEINEDNNSKDQIVNTKIERNIIFYTGVLGLLLVPVFKIVTGLPPYMGMLLSLGILWIISEWTYKNKTSEDKRKVSVIYALKKVDTPTIFFF